jgi:polyvinyl alcohol dehydrogenase (cytochrome)
MPRAVAAASLFIGCGVACGGDPAASAPTKAQTRATSAARPTSPANTANPAHRLGAADWPTYHRTNARDGNAATLAPLSDLSVDWRAHLDGAVYGQPLVVGDRVFAATEHDTVYALDPGSGKVLWSAHVGDPVPRADLPCGNIDPLGITGTMVYDPATNQVFALAETAGGKHTLVGVDADTGRVRVRAAAEPPRGDPIAHQQRGALTLLGDRVYIPYGGLLGDCGDYIGSVVSVATDGRGKVRAYAVPTTREGGIWGTGGAVVDGGRLLYAAGNGESTGDYDGSDSVISLSADLDRTAFFAPSTWADDNARDLDLGSMSPAVAGSYVYIAGKRGVGYVLRRGDLGGIGGEVARLTGCRAFGGSAVVGTTVYVPCTDGTRAVSINAAGTPRTRWHAGVAAAGSPVVGGGAVWVVDYDAGTLYALDPGNGSVRAKVNIGAAPHFASPTLSGARAYVGTLDGVVAVGGA